MAARKRKRTTKKSTQRLRDAPVGALVRQPHGGALRNGGTNRGGPGRPPEHLRLRSREVYEKFLDWAERKVENRKTKDDTMLQIGKTSGRYGFPSEDMISRQLVRERLQKQIEVLLATFDAQTAERAISVLHTVWFPA